MSTITIIVPKNASVIVEAMDNDGELFNKFQITHGAKRLEVRDITEGESRGAKGRLFTRELQPAQVIQMEPKQDVQPQPQAAAGDAG